MTLVRRKDFPVYTTFKVIGNLYYIVDIVYFKQKYYIYVVVDHLNYVFTSGEYFSFDPIHWWGFSLPFVMFHY